MRQTCVPSTECLAIIIAALALTRPAVAEYSWQVTGGRQTVEAGNQIDGSTSTITATRFFKPVSEELGPAAHSAFLSRTSSVSLGGYDDEQAQRVVFDLVGGQPTTIDTTAEGASLAGRYVLRESGWYVGGGIEDAELEQPSFTPAPDTTVRDYRVYGGKYLGPSTSLDLALRSSTTMSNYPDSSICSSPFVSCIEQTEAETDEIAVHALHVGAVGAMQYSVSGSIATRDGNLSFAERPVVTQRPTSPPFRPNLPPIGGGYVVVLTNVPLPTQQDASFAEVDTYSVAGELFPTRRLGVRVGYTSWDGDALRDHGYEIAATWFVVRKVGLRFAFARTTNDDRLEADLRTFDTSMVQLIGRF